MSLSRLKFTYGPQQVVVRASMSETELRESHLHLAATAVASDFGQKNIDWFQPPTHGCIASPHVKKAAARQHPTLPSTFGHRAVLPNTPTVRAREVPRASEQRTASETRTWWDEMMKASPLAEGHPQPRG